MAPKNLKTHKWHLSDEQIALAPPSKKVKSLANTARRSHHVGKGTGGAAEQLQKVGDAIAVQSQKMQDRLKDAREVPNPMAPESLTKRVKKVHKLSCSGLMLTLPFIQLFRHRRL